MNDRSHMLKGRNTYQKYPSNRDSEMDSSNNTTEPLDESKMSESDEEDASNDEEEKPKRQIVYQVIPESNFPDIRKRKQSNTENPAQCNCLTQYGFYVLAIVVVFAAVPMYLNLDYGQMIRYVRATNTCDEQDLSNFSEEIRMNVQSAVNEIQNFKKPSVLTFIYTQSKSEEQIDDFLDSIIKYATCKLNGGNEYVNVTSEDVHHPNIVADRGLFITKYTDLLKQRKVMLVKHLEEVPPSVALAFHYFCDQYSPIVEQALFIFTIKHDDKTNVASEFCAVENVLVSKWLGALKADQIPPLIARLSNAIIRI